MSGAMRTGAGSTARHVIWHDVECGGYATDLALWRALARESEGPVLEIGCGTGRVALDLARAGHRVTAIDSDPVLVEALRSRAAKQDLDVTARTADARELALGERYGLVIVPMQMIQLLAGPGERGALLAAVAAHLAPGGTAGIAIVEGVPVDDGELAQPLPDVAEIDGWVYSSLPLEIVVEGSSIRVSRLRQAVSPDGAIEDALDVTRLAVLAPDQLEAEACAAGLRATGRREVPSTDLHVGSAVLLLQAVADAA